MREVTMYATVVAFAIVGVRVFSDHVLALISRFVGLGLSG